MRRLIQVLLLCVLSTPMWGQYVHHYTYNNAGNRVQRQLIYWFTDEPQQSLAKVAPKDSVKTSKVGDMMTFKVYPNPNNGQFQVSTENYKDGVWLELLDAAGRQIYKQLITESTTQVDITHAGAGVFVLICRDKTQILGRWKVVTEQ